MDMCSNKAYLKRSSATTQKIGNSNLDVLDQVDTNVVQIKFDILKGNLVQIHQGDPVYCGQCNSILNKHSIVSQMEGDQFQAQRQQWICEFCYHENIIDIEFEEIPKGEDTVYLVQSVQEIQIQNENQNQNIDNTIIFCIDNSGSMTCTTEVKGNIDFKNGISEEELQMLKQFIEPGDENQFMECNTKNYSFISRKQCVLTAIESQIKELQKSHPNKMVGLVTFNNEVVLFGDGSQLPITLTGDKLYKEDDLRQQVRQVAQQILTKPIKEQAQQIIEKFANLQENGPTALGPALLASIELAKQGKPGSMVIMCTDGLANLGVGSLDNGQDECGFYDNLSNFAADNGIVISVVTIKGEGCRMDILSQLVEKTNGTVTRVKPQDIDKDFANILSDELVGTQVELVIKLHQALQFRNEDDPSLTTTLKRNIGNATAQTIVTFEYQLKNDEALQAENINIQELKKIPFQMRVSYTNLMGDKLMRVITQVLDTTDDVNVAEQNSKVKVIHTRMAQQTAKLAKKGQYQTAKQFNNKWETYVQDNKAINQNSDNKKQNLSFKRRNTQLQQVVERSSQRSINKQQEFLKDPTTVVKQKQQQVACKQVQLQKVTQVKSKAIEQQPQKQKKSAIQQQQQQQKQLQHVSESEDEDQEIADLVNFIQAKR